MTRTLRLLLASLTLAGSLHAAAGEPVQPVLTDFFGNSGPPLNGYDRSLIDLGYVDPANADAAFFFSQVLPDDPEDDPDTEYAEFTPSNVPLFAIPLRDNFAAFEGNPVAQLTLAPANVQRLAAISDSDIDESPVTISNPTLSIELFADEELAVPLVTNFLLYAETEFTRPEDDPFDPGGTYRSWDNVLAHRSVADDDFKVFQLGGWAFEPTSTYVLRTVDTTLSSVSTFVVEEDDPDTFRNFRGRVTYALGASTTASAQWFINLSDNTDLDQLAFSAFGEVIANIELLDTLNAIPTYQIDNDADYPLIGLERDPEDERRPASFPIPLDADIRFTGVTITGRSETVSSLDFTYTIEDLRESRFNDDEVETTAPYNGILFPYTITSTAQLDELGIPYTPAVAATLPHLLFVKTSLADTNDSVGGAGIESQITASYELSGLSTKSDRLFIRGDAPSPIERYFSGSFDYDSETHFTPWFGWWFAFTSGSPTFRSWIYHYGQAAWLFVIGSHETDDEDFRFFGDSTRDSDSSPAPGGHFYYDAATGDTWFTLPDYNFQIEPDQLFLYSYGLSEWLRYERGSSPERIFTRLDSNTEITEAQLIELISPN